MLSYHISSALSKVNRWPCSLCFQGVPAFFEEGRYKVIEFMCDLKKTGSAKQLQDDLGSPEISLFSPSRFTGTTLTISSSNWTLKCTQSLFVALPREAISFHCLYKTDTLCLSARKKTLISFRSRSTQREIFPPPPPDLFPISEVRIAWLCTSSRRFCFCLSHKVKTRNCRHF